MVSNLSNKLVSCASKQASIEDVDYESEQINDAYFGFRKDPQKDNILHKKIFEAISPKPLAISRYFTATSYVSPRMKNHGPLKVKRVKQQK